MAANLVKDIVKAPFTADQVASLTAYQNSGRFHAFTCGNGCGLSLIATPDGWTCPGECRYGQNWAHDFMANWAWNNGERRD